MGKREHIYKIIAENIRKERRRLGITQAELAERADVSLDTIKSVENGRRAMSLDTYLNIVHALESSPMVLMSQQHPKKHIERLLHIPRHTIEFLIHDPNRLGCNCSVGFLEMVAHEINVFFYSDTL